MHYKEVKGILSNTNGMNIYRGCSHGCIYCDSRSKCYQMDHEFTDIEIKKDADKLLDVKLRSAKKKFMIGTGSMGDPYCHVESDEKLFRRCLEVIYKYSYGVSIQTKSTRLLRDLDLLCKINEKSKVVVNVTLTTFDEELCKKVEPNVSTTKERFEMLKILRDNNIPTIVWLCPILPFINDTKENIKGIMDYCIKAKVYGIICFGMGLTLRKGNREYFYNCLDKMFPGLKDKYIKNYGDKYSINSFNNNQLMKFISDECDNNDIIFDNNKLFKYMHEFEEKNNQLSLF